MIYSNTLGTEQLPRYRLERCPMPQLPGKESAWITDNVASCVAFEFREYRVHHTEWSTLMRTPLEAGTMVKTAAWNFLYLE